MSQSNQVKQLPKEREQHILQYWQQNDTFRQSVELRKHQPPFVLYEGPPTANGSPHIGHVLGRVLKDLVCRYKTMRGYHVERRAGWDTHGLPVELGVQKQLGLSGKADIEQYGVAPFIAACKASVFRYEQEWRHLTEDIGYWTDLDDPYVTMDDHYIERVWHILANIHRQGHLYQGHRVSPYCPHCQTTLSSHEVAQGYEDTEDWSATVRFRLVDSGDSLLAWTTTPWTLPANTALAVNRQMIYVRARIKDEIVIVAEDRAASVLGEHYEVLARFSGEQLLDQRYIPLYADLDHVQSVVPPAYRVVHGEFVDTKSGTGIVHIAPAYGDDDYRLGMKEQLGMLDVLDAAGRFKISLADCQGKFFKDGESPILTQLQEAGALFEKARYTHSYPFCWRCHSPLIYRAMESWFIRTTALRDEMIAANQDVTWHPGHLRDGRFGHFLEELVDWNISRNRYWGTPLNIWQCQACHYEYAPDSLADLRNRAQAPLGDDFEPHKPQVDQVHLNCPQCGDTMTRTPEVIDVWFDSGSMPFAQRRGPLDAKESVPAADLIIEAIDQTRGWFFSLLAVSMLRNGTAPYKAVLSTGHVLDENGQKMSKSQGNVIDPYEILNTHGADALRWSLLSGSNPWNNKRYAVSMAAESRSRVIDTLLNVLSFYQLYADIDGYCAVEDQEQDYAQLAQTTLAYPEPPTDQPLLPLDLWLLSRLHHTAVDVRDCLDRLDVLQATKDLESLIDDLSNWYVRRSRQRYWRSGLDADKRTAFRLLHHALNMCSRMLAPFLPFLAEHIHQQLGGGESVHLCDYPDPQQQWIDVHAEASMQDVRRAVELGRRLREQHQLRNRQPLAVLYLISPDTTRWLPYLSLIGEELNVKSVEIVADDDAFSDLSFKLDLRAAGSRYGALVPRIRQHLANLKPTEARTYLELGAVPWTDDALPEGKIPLTNLLVERSARTGYALATEAGVQVALDIVPTTALLAEGRVREVIRLVQDYRKQLDLPLEQRINLTIDANQELTTILQQHRPLLEQHVLLATLSFGHVDNMHRYQQADVHIGLAIDVNHVPPDPA